MVLFNPGHASLACPSRLHRTEGRKRLGLCRLPRRACDRRILRHRCGDRAPIARRRAGSACDGARRRPSRRARQGDGLHSHALDVRATAEIAKLADSIEVDVLVNNAGQSRQGDVLSNSADDVDQLIDVNLRAILHLTRLFVPGMVKRNRGHVVSITSIAGHYAFPGGNTVYQRDQGGRSFPVAAAARPSLRLARARDRDLAGAGRDRGVRPPAGRRRGSAAALL